MSDYSLKLFKLRMYHWVFLGICMLAGALGGMLISYLVKPVYEAEALLTANMEIVREGNVTEIMVDSQMTIIGMQVFDSKVVEVVLLTEKSLGHELTYEEFRDNASFERQMMNTSMKYRDFDPAIAQRMVNTWANVFHSRLLEAHPYGIAVSEARDTLEQIRKCQTDKTAGQTSFCLALNPEKEENLKNEANAIILEQSPLSLGLTTALSIGNVIPAEVPDAPLRYTRGSLVLAGAMIGMVGALLLIEILPRRKEANA